MDHSFSAILRQRGRLDAPKLAGGSRDIVEKCFTAFNTSITVHSQALAWFA